MALIPLLKIFFIYLALLVFHWSPTKAGLIERSATHYGKQFVLGFTAQTESMFHTGYNEILISAPLDTYVTISLHKSHRRESILKNRFVKAGNILKYRLSTSARMHSTMKQNLGILVEASADVAVSCLNQGRYTADSYLALPVNVLGKKYVVASYAKSNVGIIAPQDNTTVYIIAKDIVRYRGRSYRKGENITIKLNKLQSFHLDHHSDLSGTIIRANKPVAVLSGDKCAKTNTKYCDHLVEFLLPFENWGRKFVVATTGKMDKNTGDIFRVFAYESDTRVRSKDGDRMLKSGQFAEYRFGRQELSLLLECSKPCSVIQYTTGYLNEKRREVDSSMIVVPSVNQYLNSYEIPLSGGQRYFYQHSLTLVIKTSERNGLILNGKNATHLRWQNVDGTKYSWTIFQMSSETAITHISQEVSFSVLAFGEADFQSHGYPGGFNFLIKKSAICKKISSINNGEVISNGMLEGDEISFVCGPNYVLVGEKVLRCLSTGEWNASEPQCEEQCPDPSESTNAIVKGKNFYHGKKVEFACTKDEVLTPEISRRLTCEYGTWKGVIPSCKASCPYFKQMQNGVVSGTKRTHGSTIQFTCNDGYQQIGASSATCEDGKWSETLPRCLAPCSVLSGISNGVVNGKTRTHGSIIKFKCNDGYQLIGASIVTCEDGKWSETLPRCLAVCKKISSINNGTVIGNGNVEGDEIEFRCYGNYTLVGDQVLRCTNKGRWNTSQPKCKVTCPDPRTQTNARVIGNEFGNEKEVEFTCSDDYVLIPEYSRKLKCENGKWKGVIPLCKASCPPLSKISKGVVKGTKRTHGSMIQFKCNYRYQLIGASSATCEDGKWSKTLPRCAAICRKIFAIKNGKVIGSGTLEGDKIHFACNENYLLIGEQVLECKSDGGWNASEPKCKVPASWSRWEGWSDCSVSCNNGTQTRKRICVGTISSQKEEKRCHGKSMENRTCATWKCPDCNKRCEAGKLNIDCDTCICDDNILTGIVKDNGGVLLDNATIALSESPFKILARSNVVGKFVVNGMCISEDIIIVSRDGYIPQKIKTTKINPTTARVTAILKRIVFPEVTGHPQSKLRLEGQSMTLCCESKSSTTVRFEWVINGRAADEYQHDELQSSKLVIPQISRNMSGEIKCRVYNDHGAEFSDPANVTVLSSTDDSCEPTPSVRIIKLPPGCTYEGRNSIDIGQCHKSKCIARGLNNISNCEENFCCQPKTTNKIKIKCKSIYFNMTQVTQCGCGDCFPGQTVVKGIARGGADNIPFKYGYIYHGDKYLTRTGRKGEFYFKIPGHFSRLVVTFKDKRGYNNFQDLTKVIALIPGRKIYVEARMKERPKPITVNAKEGFEIPLGSLATSKRPNEAADDTDSSKRSNPAVALSLPPQSLVTDDGTIYDGQTKVEVSFVDPRNAAEVEEVGGDFTTVSENGEEQLLETFGVIKMEFRDVNGKRLQPNSDINVLLDLDEYNITEKEAENIKFWYMDVKTGRWRIMDQGLKPHETRRSRRSGRKFYYGKIDNKLYQHDINLDAWADTCLFKVKFDDFGIENFNTVDLTVLTTKGNLNRYQTEGVDANSAACVHTYCAGNEAIIRATLNGEFLIPNETGIYSDVNNIEYYRSSDVTDRFSNRITIKELTQPLGPIPSPFYNNEISCKNSLADYSFTFNMPKISEDVDLIENFEENWYPDPVLAKTCFVKILVDNINRCPNRTIYFVVQSVLGENQAPAGHVLLRLTESKSTACAEYKCPERKNHKIRVNVTALAEGYFIENHEATREFLNEMSSTVSDDFSFEPEFDIRKPSIGIIQSEEEMYLDEKKEEKVQYCMKEMKAGIRFRCSTRPLFPLRFLEFVRP